MAFIPSRFNTHRDIKHSEFTWKQTSIIPPSTSFEKCFGKPLKYTTSGGMLLCRRHQCAHKSNPDPAHPAPQNLASQPAPGDKDPATWVMWATCAEVTWPLDVIPFSLKWRAEEYLPGRGVFTWQNKVPPTHQGAAAVLCCKVPWPHRHKPSSRENNPVLAGERTTEPKTCAVFLWLFRTVPYWRRYLTTTLQKEAWSIHDGHKAPVCCYIHWSSSAAWGLMPRPEHVLGAHFAVTQEEFSAFFSP